VVVTRESSEEIGRAHGRLHILLPQATNGLVKSWQSVRTHLASILVTGLQEKHIAVVEIVLIVCRDCITCAKTMANRRVGIGITGLLLEVPMRNTASSRSGVLGECLRGFPSVKVLW